jgi:hypothetical protein
MSWWNIVKMSERIQWLVDQLSDNDVVEITGSKDANEIELIVAIPIDPRFIEWMNKKYKIELIGEPWRMGTRNKYKIEVIGE